MSSASPSRIVRFGVAASSRLHGSGVELSIGLRARPAHGRSLAPVEKPELDSGAIGDPAHDPVERIDLAHEMAFAEAADRRVAGHGADRVRPMRDQSGPRAHAGRGGGRLGAGVAAADHDHIERLVHDEPR